MNNFEDKYKFSQTDLEILEILLEHCQNNLNSNPETVAGRLVKLDPFGEKRLYFKGYILIKSYKYDKATELLNQCIELIQTQNLNSIYYEWALNDLAYIYIQLGKYAEALQNLEIVYNIQKTQDKILSLNTKFKIAEVYTLTRDFKKALNSYMQIQQEADKLNEIKLILETLLNISYINLHLRNFTLAEKNLKSIIADKTCASYPEIQAKAHANLALVFEALKNRTKALHHYNIAKEICHSLNNLQFEASLELNIGIANFELKKFEISLFHLLRSYKLFKKSQNFRQAGVAALNISLIYEIINKLNMSIKYQIKALNLFKLVDDKPHIGESLINLGHLYFLKSDFKNARLYTKKALKEFKNNTHARMIILENLANIEYKCNNLDLAYETAKSAYRLSAKLANEQVSGRLLKLIGSIEFDLHKLKEAENSLLKSKKIFEKYKNFREVAEILFNLGNVYLTQTQYTKSYECYLTALELYSNFNEPFQVSLCLSNLANLSFILNNPKSALEFLIQAENIDRTYNFKDKLKDDYKNLNIVYAKLGNHKKAAYYKMLYKNV